MVLNRTRRLYRKILEGRQPSEAKKQKAIAASAEFKALIESPGWKRLDEWMDTMSLGGHELLQYENRNINSLSLFSFFNNFLKYIALTYENRAYNKIRKYLEISIQKGDKYAEEIAKAEAMQNEEK